MKGAKPQAGAEGFTLLEILVVVTVIGILAGMVVPSLMGQRGRDVNDAAERLILLINRAQQEAKLSGRVWRVVLEPGAGRYRFQERSGDEFRAVGFRPFRDARETPGIRWRRLTVNGQRAQGTASVHLFPTGEQDAFGLILAADDHRRRVVMGPVGRARVARGQ